MEKLNYPVLNELLEYVKRKYGAENYYFQTFYECFKVFFKNKKNIENEIITPDIIAIIKQNKYDYLINSNIFREDNIDIKKLIKWYNFSDPQLRYIKIYEDDYMDIKDICKQEYKEEGFDYIIEKLLVSGMVIFYSENLDTIFDEIYNKFYQNNIAKNNVF